MTEPNEFSSIEQRVSDAFQAHAESVQVSPDAYARLARRVNAPAGGGILGHSSFFRPLGFIAAAVAVIGVSGFALSLQGQGVVETAIESPAAVDPGVVLGERAAGSSPDADLEITEPSPPQNPESYRAGGTGAQLSEGVQGQETTASGELVESDPEDPFANVTYAPVGVTPVAAAEKFLNLIGFENLVVDESGAGTPDDLGAFLLDVLSPAGDEGEEPKVLSTLVIYPHAEFYLVEEARSEAFDFAFVGASADDPTDDDNFEDQMVIDSLAAIQLSDPQNGIVLADLKPVHGGGDVATEIPLGSPDDLVGFDIVGADRVWVVAGGRYAGGEFAAKPAYIVGRDDPSTYSVIGLPPDDRDGGLVVRDGPGGQQIDVLPLGSGGVSRRSIPPVRVGKHIWWAVTTPNGINGWAASDYLLPNDSVDDQSLIELAGGVVETALAQTYVNPVQFAYPVYVGDLTRPQLVTDGLENPIAWLSPLVVDRDAGDAERTMREFYDVQRWADADISIPDSYLDPNAARAANAYFGDLPSVALTTTNPDTGLTERVHIFVSSDMARHRNQHQLSVVGIVVETQPSDAVENGDDVVVDADGDPDGPTVTPDPSDSGGSPEPDVPPPDPVTESDS